MILKSCNVFFLIAVMMIINSHVVFSQDLQKQKLDKINSDEITQTDFLQALELAGIKIHKFDIGVFESVYKIKFVIEEFRNSELYKIDTLNYDIENVEYVYADTNQVSKEVEYIEVFSRVIRVFTHIHKEKLIFQIKTPRVTFTEDLEFKLENDGAFYKIVEYENTKWKLDEKIPLLLCGSSWIDTNGIRRFCSATKVGNNSRTKSLLDSSPQYFIISYFIEKFEN